MTGLLRINGKIDLSQFWPNGESDADTSKVQIEVEVRNGSFSFAADRKKFKTTHAFDDAYAKGTSRKKLIDSNSRITIRLQGIDAPELHYRAGALKMNPKISDTQRKAYNTANKTPRRQYQAETATVALGKKLAQYGQGSIRCQVFSFVDHPYDVVDTYGRFVGNIRVGSNFKTDINVWLAQEGWAYPTFYSSMENDEIEGLLKASAKSSKKNVWKYYSVDTSKFDPTLVYRRKPAQPAPEKDKGPILMPKLFRRQLAYKMEREAKVFKGNFREFLQSRPDACFALRDFLENGVHSATEHKFHEFLNGTKFTLKPHEIVFKEKPATVVDGRGRIIKNF